jgi:sugar-specific transcriptional regulator TrmB
MEKLFIPQTHAFYDYLTLAGLSSQQALLYESLLKTGPRPASKVAKDTHIERVIAYRVLDQLLSLNLVIKKDEPGKVAVFEAAHPSRLEELAERKEKEAKTAKDSLHAVLPDLSSAYNLSIGKPGVRFYEGLEGIKMVVADTLSAQGEVLQYLDAEELESRFPKEYEFYTKKRLMLKIKKRILVRDTEYARKKQWPVSGTTTLRFLPTTQAFQALMYIYDNKIGFMTLDPNRLVGIIIEDKILADMNRVLFETLWVQGAELNVGVASSVPTS